MDWSIKCEYDKEVKCYGVWEFRTCAYLVADKTNSASFWFIIDKLNRFKNQFIRKLFTNSSFKCEIWVVRFIGTASTIHQKKEEKKNCCIHFSRKWERTDNRKRERERKLERKNEENGNLVIIADFVVYLVLVSFQYIYLCICSWSWLFLFMHKLVI